MKPGITTTEFAVVENPVTDHAAASDLHKQSGERNFHVHLAAINISKID
jgi:hypothetical protein